ncbi:MAG: FtsX-like permease family protein [bacterium]|nr:FtsX-like permease family protein [bacterium]
MSQLFQDLRQSVRLMRHRPGFTAVIVLSIALGVGANTAIFSIANMLLLRPLPFPDDQELMRVRCLMHQEGREPRRISISEFNIGALRDQATTMEEVAGWLYQTYNLVGSEQPVQVWGATTTANALQVMGVEPIMGRFILPEEDQPSAAAKVMVISYVLWQNQFGGDPDIIGKVVKLNDDPHTVIGVMPAFFEYPYKSKVWIPLGLNPSRSIRANWLHSVARLKEGVTREQAMEELDLIAARLEQEYPDTHTGWSFILTPLREDLTSDLHPQRVVLLLMAGAGFLVLIACANVANMLLSRSLEQSGEVAIRAALGISRIRLIRELITQGVVLALIGGALGILIGYWTVQPLIAIHPSEDLNRIFLEVKLDHRVLGFTLLLSVVVGVLFSLVPALRASRPNLQSLLMEGSRTTPSLSGRRLLKGVVVAEMAVAVCCWWAAA